MQRKACLAVGTFLRRTPHEKGGKKENTGLFAKRVGLKSLTNPFGRSSASARAPPPPPQPFLAQQRQDAPDKVTTVFTVRYIILPGRSRYGKAAYVVRYAISSTYGHRRTRQYGSVRVRRVRDGPLHGITIPAARQGWRARFINRLQQRITRTPGILLPPSDLPLTLRGNILRRPVDDPKLIFKSVRTVPRAPRLGSS